VAEPDLAGVDARLGSPVLVHRQPVAALGDGELPQVVIEPSHGGLDDVVQGLERDRGRYLDLAPDHRVAVLELDAKSGDLVEAVGGGAGGAHAASLAGPLFQFQGRSSASRACLYRKLDSNIAMMQAADHGLSNDATILLDWSADRRILG